MLLFFVVAVAVGTVSSRFRSHSIGWQRLLTLAHYPYWIPFAWLCICISAKLFVWSCLTVFRKLVPFSVINDFISSLMLLCPLHLYTHTQRERETRVFIYCIPRIFSWQFWFFHLLLFNRFTFRWIEIFHTCSAAAFFFSTNLTHFGI